MANANDSAVIAEMLCVPEDLMAAYFAVESHRIQDDISWTRSKKVAEMFSEGGKRQIVERRFRKNQVFALFDRRGEEEILVIQRTQELKGNL